MGDKNPRYKHIDMNEFINLVNNNVYYSLICRQLNISQSHYYNIIKKIKYEKTCINTKNA